MFTISTSKLLAALSLTIAIVCLAGVQVQAIPTALKLAAPGDEAYGLCQTDCNTRVVACYAAHNATFGTVVAVHGQTLPGILACNLAQGACHAACAQKHLSKNNFTTTDVGNPTSWREMAVMHGVIRT
ncbi:hypothetical protein AB1N83_002121 [Pleurotus pulmonarius]